VSEKDGVSSRLTPLTVAAALKTLAVTISRHSERNADAIEVVSAALREMHHELKQERARGQALQSRVAQLEERLAQQEALLAALRRQGWIQ
jgi:hypothetical protein